MAHRFLENARLNHLEVALCPFALSNVTGTAWLSITPGNLGMSNLADSRAGGASVLCATISGDELVSESLLSQPTVIKLDVEGAEQAALEGMRGVLASPALKAVVFESYHDLEQRPTLPVYAMLAAAGFRLQKLSRHEPTEHNLENFLAVR